ncbi:DUF2332 domain-containing protein [Arthrobacter sp. CAU 1506]|uniref:DUF2332 domain-containing protein n=1 Tax=Arthrobacter sp. CAU 1506 TaxID=2560052 RepID=UPI0010AD1820|nr:DUF2332 domain-containing protein [Arthrobacter sp. CAU 1506]TJY69844.1 DUF2332 domain-containing protein [Arthrobacter sp. CAU 1506]
METAGWYRNFGLYEAAGQSETYVEWTLGISQDPEVLDLINALPPAKRQPNLVLAAARSLGVGTPDYAGFRRFLLSHGDAVRAVALARSTQTNEPGRCAVLLPSLAAIATAEAKPLALIEVGASAGLVLYPDRYRYQYDGGAIIAPQTAPSAGAGSRNSGAPPADGTAPEPPILACATSGNPPLPTSLPDVSWRAGIDLNPLDVTAAGDVAWLEALIWPGQEFRVRRLRRAVEVARRDPPRLVAGDLNQLLPELVSQAPQDAVVVVLHSAVLAYLPEPDRLRFRTIIDGLIRDRGVHWLANEGPGVMPMPTDCSGVPGLDDRTQRGRFLLSHNGRPVATTGPHGQFLDWLPPESA